MLRPFIPARDYDLSKRFYEALGFVSGYADDTVVVMTSPEASFILQNFYVAQLADNFMVQLVVDDCEAWWLRVDPANVAKRFGTREPSAPTMQSWGSKVGFVHDPSSVLWHVTEMPRR